MKPPALVIAGILAVPLCLQVSSGEQSGTGIPRPRTDADFGKAPLQFIPGEGQADGSATYYVQGRDKTIYFAAEGLTFVLNGPQRSKGERSGGMPSPTGPTARKRRMLGVERSGGAGGLPAGLSSERWAVKLDFVGANPDTMPMSLEEPGAVISHFKGKPEDWEAGLPASSKIVYRELWPGIDLVYSGTMDRIRSEFIIHPGADPSRIKLAYRGVETIALVAEGRLGFKTPAGDFEDDLPVAYQEIEGRRRGVPVTLSLEDAGESRRPEAVSGSGVTPGAGAEGPTHAYSFELGAYELGQTLVLDVSGAGGYFGRKTGTTSIEVTGGHAGGSEFTLTTGQWIARIGVLGYMKNSAANGTWAIYKDTGTPDVKQHVCHTVTGALPVGSGNKAWTVLEVSGGPVWLDAGDYWILRNDSGDASNKFVIDGQDMGSSKWGWCFIDYPDWPDNTRYLSWVENYSNVEGCLYAEWDGATIPSFTLASTPTTVTVTAGQSARYTIQLTPLNGSVDTSVSFRCTGLPEGCTASFSPANMTPGANPTSTTLTLKTLAPAEASAGGMFGAPTPILMALGFLAIIPAFGPWIRFRRSVPARPRRRWLTAAALICAIELIGSCSAGTNNTSPGTYQITVHGESGSLKASTTVTLIVN